MSYSLGVYLTPFVLLVLPWLAQLAAGFLVLAIPYGMGYYIGRYDARRNPVFYGGSCSDPRCPLAGVPREVL